VHLSVRPSASRSSTETAKRITQTTPHDGPGTLVFCCRKARQNSNGITPNENVKGRWGRLNAGAVAEYWRLSTQSVVNLAWSQVYHTCLQHVRRDAAHRAGFVSDRWSLFSWKIWDLTWKIY